MTWVITNDHYFSLPSDNLTFFTYLFDRRFYFHIYEISLFLFSPLVLPIRGSFRPAYTTSIYICKLFARDLNHTVKAQQLLYPQVEYVCNAYASCLKYERELYVHYLALRGTSHWVEAQLPCLLPQWLLLSLPTAHFLKPVSRPAVIHLSLLQVRKMIILTEQSHLVYKAVRIKGSVSVTAIVCSKWTDGFLSFVTTVH